MWHDYCKLVTVTAFVLAVFLIRVFTLNGKEGRAVSFQFLDEIVTDVKFGR